MDARVNFTDQIILPGGSRAVQLFSSASAVRYRYTAELQAALFADGTSFGDPATVDLLRERRQRVFDSIAAYDLVLRRAWQQGGRVAAISAVQSEHQNQQSTGVLQRLDLPRKSAEDLVARYVLDSLGLLDLTCDDACADRRVTHLLDGLSAWQSRVTVGLSERH